MPKSVASLLILIVFFITSVIGPIPVMADEFRLPAPGVMVRLSPPLTPPMLKGIKVHPENPFRFDFILDKGDSELSSTQLKAESSKLIKYFLASLTIPEKDLWVNLSPYEKDRIIPQSFGLTTMGRDLLAEDYMLKQITASLIYPEDEIGKKFWKRIYEEAQKKFGTTNIPVNTFNKVWIVPDKAVVYENAKAGTAYVVESKLKVMLEQDYLSLKKHEGIADSHSVIARSEATKQSFSTGALGSQVLREIIIPELTKEVNEDKNFAQLRQVYNSLILATWYKKKIKDSILSQMYSDKSKVAGVNIDDPKEKQKIYQQYLKAFKKGVYNYIKEDVDPVTQETIPRKYFSGGMAFDHAMSVKLQIVTGQAADSAMRSRIAGILTKSLFVVLASLNLSGDIQNNRLENEEMTKTAETTRPIITEKQIKQVQNYVQDWEWGSHQDNINAPLAVDVIEAALNENKYILSQEQRDRIIRERENPTNFFQNYTIGYINSLISIPSIRHEFVRRNSPIRILRMITSFSKLEGWEFSPIIDEQIDDYIDLIKPEVLNGSEGKELIRNLLKYKYDNPREDLRNIRTEKPKELIDNPAKAREFAEKLSANGKIDVLIQYLLSHDKDSSDVISLLSETFNYFSEKDQRKIIDAFIYLIFDSKDENVRVEAEKILFTAAILPKYAYIIEKVGQQREKVNTLPNYRASKDVQLIVFDDFKETEENGLIHGEMVLSRILTGFLGRPIDLTKNDYAEQLKLPDKSLSRLQAAKYVFRQNNIFLHAVQANQSGSIAMFRAMLDHYKNHTVVANISMGGYTKRILWTKFTQDDPEKVNGSFPLDMFAPSKGQDHLFFLSAGNGREFNYDGGEQKLSLGKPRIYSIPESDQFVYTGASFLNPKTGQWERKIYSDWGSDVTLYAPTGPWDGTSFSAPFAAGEELKLVSQNPLMSDKSAKESLITNPEIHTTVNYDKGYSKASKAMATDRAMNTLSPGQMVEHDRAMKSIPFNKFNLDIPQKSLIDPQGNKAKLIKGDADLVFMFDEGLWKDWVFRVPSLLSFEENLESYKIGSQAKVVPPIQFGESNGKKLIAVARIYPVKETKNLMDLLGSWSVDDKYVKLVRNLYVRMIKQKILCSDSMSPLNVVVGYLNGRLGAWVVDADTLRKVSSSEKSLAGAYLYEMQISDWPKGRITSVVKNLLKHWNQAMTTLKKQITNTGGIDLTPANMNLQTRNSVGEIKFHINPAMLEQLQNAPGFVPVIINIQPLKNIQQFLGLNQSAQAAEG